jgi:hypothetical protein
MYPHNQTNSLSQTFLGYSDVLGSALKRGTKAPEKPTVSTAIVQKSPEEQSSKLQYNQWKLVGKWKGFKKGTLKRDMFMKLVNDRGQSCTPGDGITVMIDGNPRFGYLGAATDINGRGANANSKQILVHTHATYIHTH